MRSKQRLILSIIIILCVTVIAYNFLLLFMTGSVRQVQNKKQSMGRDRQVAVAEARRGLSGSVNRPIQRHRKKILLYTALFGAIPWKNVPYSYSFTDFDGKRCPVNDCDLTYDKNELENSDLVVFHGRDLPTAEDLRKVSHKSRRHNQAWLYFMHESPLYSYTKFPSYSGLFNWTASYRPESDILVTYHFYKELARDEAKKNFAQGKTNQVIVIMSHCVPFRIKLVKELRKYMNIDVYGACSKHFQPQTEPCPKSPKCDAIIKKYKFYLAIENSFCKGYITEKYWLNALDMGLVPIVLGGGDYNDSRIAIPGSFINILDLKNLEQLGAHINYLDKNDKAYNAFHSWRYKYKLYPHNSMCIFCKAAHEHKVPRKTVDLEEFWGVQNCDVHNTIEHKLTQKGSKSE